LVPGRLLQRPAGTEMSDISVMLGLVDGGRMMRWCQARS
jgi:hypothetical protein